MSVKLDILAIGVHPDDVELGCGGTVLKHVELGYTVGILDLTQGELGTRGTGKLRLKEAEAAAKILGVSIRENAGLADGFFQNDKEHQLNIIKYLRKYRPNIVLTNAIDDRHPDHGRAARLTKDACFLSGLPKVETQMDGEAQEAWRPKAVYHYIQAKYIQADFTVDISPYFEKKMEAVLTYKSQFFDPNSNEPETFISSPDFLEMVKARAIDYGRFIGVQYAEGFTTNRYPGVKDLFDLD